MNLLPALTILILTLVAALAAFTWRTARRVERLLPPAGRFVDVPGARLHVLDQGSGPALLMIHGLGGQMGHYRAGVLERLAGDFRCVLVDRPGSGYSRRGTGTPATLEAQADALAALIDQLQLGRPVVVGHSLGGALALVLALRHADKVAGLALLAPLSHVPRSVSPVFQGLLIRRPWLRSLIGWTMATPMVMTQGRPMMDLIFGPEAVPADYGTRGGGLMNLRPSQFVAASQDINALPASLPALQRRYGELRLPLAVLYGRGDRILDPQANGQALVDQVPGAVLELIDGGHMLPVTQPQRSAQFIRAAALRALGREVVPAA